MGFAYSKLCGLKTGQGIGVGGRAAPGSLWREQGPQKSEPVVPSPAQRLSGLRESSAQELTGGVGLPGSRWVGPGPIPPLHTRPPHQKSTLQPHCFLQASLPISRCPASRPILLAPRLRYLRACSCNRDPVELHSIPWP